MLWSICFTVGCYIPLDFTFTAKQTFGDDTDSAGSSREGTPTRYAFKDSGLHTENEHAKAVEMAEKLRAARSAIGAPSWLVRYLFDVDDALTFCRQADFWRRNCI